MLFEIKSQCQAAVKVLVVVGKLARKTERLSPTEYKCDYLLFAVSSFLNSMRYLIQHETENH